MLRAIQVGSYFGKGLQLAIPRKSTRTVSFRNNPFTVQASSTPFLLARPLHQTSVTRNQQAQQQEEDVEPTRVDDSATLHKKRQNEDTHQRLALGPITKFHELADRQLVDANIINNITKKMGIETMTEVQSKTINETLTGDDVIAQAKTGTGKTLAFLIPVIQNILKDEKLALPARYSELKRGSPSDVRAIVISPTRELAEQIASEAMKLVNGTRIKVQVAVGGTRKNEMLRKMQIEGCHLLVGTPGRLKDILSDPRSGVRAPRLNALVLDEADRLLDQGFAPEIREIQSMFPSISEVDRQTLMFSATVPDGVRHLVSDMMKPGFKFVQTIKAGEELTHMKVPQKVVRVAGFENWMPTVVELCKRELQRSNSPDGGAEPFKAIVYFGATASVSLAAKVLRNLRSSGSGSFGQHILQPAQIFDIHARLSQAQRTAAAAGFRKAKSAILVSSDVTARGMDFPNVTHVIQVGMPSTSDTYVHRIGRTARGDKLGEGWLILHDYEYKIAMRNLGSLPLKPDSSLASASLDMTQEAEVSAELGEILTQVREASARVDEEDKSKAYRGNLGVYISSGDRRQLIQALNNWAKYGWGMRSPPAIGSGLAQKLGLSGVPGVEIGRGESSFESRGGFGNFGNFGRSPRFSGGRGQGSFPPSRFGERRSSAPGRGDGPYRGGGRGDNRLERSSMFGRG
ncbi:MAG: hypothetical protein M1829_004451 [Trizodia sp. TS-e1964]|nr:MAG: hypothetical protein M1829_004451 [Trizodia sp. TS-e1964]